MGTASMYAAALSRPRASIAKAIVTKFLYPLVAHPITSFTGNRVSVALALEELASITSVAVVRRFNLVIVPRMTTFANWWSYPLVAH
jgi:hypothetical protein